MEIKSKTGVDLKYQNIQGPLDLLNDDNLPLQALGLCSGDHLLLLNTAPPPLTPVVKAVSLSKPTTTTKTTIPVTKDNAKVVSAIPQSNPQPRVLVIPDERKKKIPINKINPARINPMAFKKLLSTLASVDAEEWTAYFESKYDALFHPQFIGKPIDIVLEACRIEKKLLLILLYSEDIKSKDFYGTILTREELSTWTDEAQIPVWVAPVSPQFPKKFSETLKVPLVYPFLALVGYKHNILHIFDIINELVYVSDLVTLLKRHLNDYNLYLEDEKSKVWHREERIRLTEEQNLAYNKSLEEDYQRVEQKKSEEELLLKQKSLLSSQRQSVIKKLYELPPEPIESPLIRIVVRLLDGSRIERKFLPTHTLEMLFEFVGGILAQKMSDEKFILPGSPPLGGKDLVKVWSIEYYEFQLNYPKRILDYSERSKTFEELGIKDQLLCFLNQKSK